MYRVPFIELVGKENLFFRLNERVDSIRMQ